ncbi:allantoicase [Streptomyces sp. AV19]|uniref:allantoicase n=1 Tax=Streptomyces sp. AV19 TaxID=2793068 RepID=UPI0018FED542|nr:allantoicase [Streptomyces sp. AV19]MBH1938348.1 allantoicase [Streptomyces sp. AV19]MDG4534997.1 allantoicase [Streptomyces sp. AV19]
MTASFTAVTSFTGAAEPYRGGDPYADYRSAAVPFEDLPDLADRRLGGAVVAANDEFFAERENLLVPGPARFDPGLFGHKGKVMDGWETRRRRGASAGAPHPADGDRDWALIRLGVPGVVRGVVVDTAHFRGNHPRAVSVEGASVPGAPSPAELLDAAWTTLVPPIPVGGHAANVFAVHCERPLTHLRLGQHPDGGVARLRVHGEAVPDPSWIRALGVLDVAALENGGLVEDASDRFYSSPLRTILPGRPARMDEGWETRRRRDDGHDWVRYRLAGRAVLRALELDTGCLKGNSAGWAEIWARDGEKGEWGQILPRTRLQPDAVHRFVVGGGGAASAAATAAAATHVRLEVYPDGGIGRLRVYGELTEGAVRGLEERWGVVG